MKYVEKLDGYFFLHWESLWPGVYDFMSNIKIFILAAPMGSDNKESERVGCRAGGDGV